jgi:hypothetical protein
MKSLLSQVKNKIITSFSKFTKEREDYFNNLISGKKVDYNNLVLGLKKEFNNTKKAKLILLKYSDGESISKEEQEFFKKQVIEVAKTIGLGIPIIIIPGGLILLSFIIWLSKKYNIDILPSYLNKKKED